MLMDAGSGALGAATSYLRGDLGGVFKSVMGVGKRIMNGDKATEYTKQTRSSNADVISWSGCKDTCVGSFSLVIAARSRIFLRRQTSADTSMQGQPTGAMSYSFIQALTKYPQQNYLYVLAAQVVRRAFADMARSRADLPRLPCPNSVNCSTPSATSSRGSTRRSRSSLGESRFHPARC